jgi:integrase
LYEPGLFPTATFSDEVSRPQRKSGLPAHATFHDLRHAFASRAAHRGVAVNVLSEVVGHSHVGVTQKVYVHLYGREAAEAAFRAALDG